MSFPLVCAGRFIPHLQTFSNLTVTRQNKRGGCGGVSDVGEEDVVVVSDVGEEEVVLTV